MQCLICNSSTNRIFYAKVLNKYRIQYFYCSNCGFLHAETPYWLDEAYKSPIADADTGLVSRNIAISKKLACILYFIFDKKGKYLDVGGGYGMLARLMRDIGFDFYWSDIYYENLLAKGFESDTTSPPFTAITCFEVLEHVINPIEFINASSKEAGTSTIIFSTELFEGSPPRPEDLVVL